MGKQSTENHFRGIDLLFFLLGGMTVMQQTLTMRELFTIAHGNELSFGLCLGSWMIGVCSGSWAGSRHDRSAEQALRRFRVILVLLALLAPVLLIATRLIHQINSSPPGAYLSVGSVFLYSLLVNAPFSFLAGLTFPLMGTLSEGGRKRFIRLYSLEAAGSVLTGVLLSLVLIGRFPHLVMTATLNAFVLTASLLVQRKPIRLRTVLLRTVPGATILLLLSMGTVSRWDRLFSEWRWRSIAPDPSLVRIDTPYQHLELGGSPDQYHLYANGQLAAVFPDDTENRIQASLIRGQHPHPKRILVIGEGVSGLIQFLIHPGLSHLMAIDLDQGLTTMIRNHLPYYLERPLQDPRVSIVNGDARRLISGGFRGRFDLIILQLPPPATTQLNRFYTREFFRSLEPVMAGDGVIAVPLIASDAHPGGAAGRFNALIYRTVQSVYPATSISTGSRSWLFASPSSASVTRDPAIMQNRNAQQEKEPGPASRLFPFFFPRNWIETTVEAWEENPKEINRDQHPLGYYLYHRLLGWFSGSRMDPLLNGLECYFPWFFWISALFILGLTALWARKRLTHRPALVVAAAAAGYSGLSLEILLLSAFQSRFGYAYRDIGLFIALFMTGLTGGAISLRAGGNGDLLWGNRLRSSFLVMIGASATALLVIRTPLPTPLPIFVVVFIAGWGVGGAIPAAIGICRAPEDGFGKAAGWINAGDYLGGTLGALLTATLFLPLLGMTGSLILIILILLTSRFSIG